MDVEHSIVQMRRYYWDYEHNAKIEDCGNFVRMISVTNQL